MDINGRYEVNPVLEIHDKVYPHVSPRGSYWDPYAFRDMKV